jgi:hypothetical protein
MTELPPILTDRTRYQTYLDCPRRRWWAFEWGAAPGSPGGVVPVMLSMPLSTGIYVHEGIAHILRHVDTTEAVEEAVHLACANYAQQVAARGLRTEPVEPSLAADQNAFTAREQQALIEALIRAYAQAQLPILLAEYDVIEVETERLMPLSDDGDDGVGRDFGRLLWQSRADALLRQRSSGDHYVLSLKTSGGAWDRRKEAENRHDVQGLSEAAAYEWFFDDIRAALASRVLEQAGSLAQIFQGLDFDQADTAYAKFQALRQMHQEHPRRIEGILMQFLLKGLRLQQGADLSGDGTKLGKWEQHSPLVRARRRQKADPVTLEVCHEYAWSHYWRCSQPHEMRKSRYYPDGSCPGDGRRHKLGDDWEVFYTWEQTAPFRVWTTTGVREFAPGIKGWIDALQAGVVQPEAGPCLPAQFVMPPPYRRQQQDLDQWRRQAAFQESEIAERAILIRLAEDPQTRQHLLDRWFGLNRRACDWPSSCPYIPLCHENTLPASEIDPLALGVYQPRRPHHQPELDAFSVPEEA